MWRLMVRATSACALAVAVAVALAVALALTTGCERKPAAPPDPLASLRWDPPPIDWSRPPPSSPPGGVRQPGFVGSAACKGCHAELYARYARHSMARTGLRPLASLDRTWLDAIFDAGARELVAHARSGFSYRPVRDGNRYFIEEVMLAHGVRVQSWRQPITHALSAGSYGLAFYFRQGGRLYQAPLDYYAKLARWGLDPGAVDGNPRFSKPLRTYCISCHSDYPPLGAGTDTVFLDPLPTGVGCERCHGPGEAHVRSLRKEDIVNPARLPFLRQLDVCAQCHESSAGQLRAGRGNFDFRPGGALDDVRVNFVAEPAEPDRMGLLAHPERLVRSACWRGSGGKLTCTSCHDPHVSSLEQPAKWWDDKCRACHAERACTGEPAARAQVGDHCVQCHMRAGPPTNPTQVTITDHWIQRRPPPLRDGTPRPAKLVAWSTLIGAPVTGSDLPGLEVLAWAELGRSDEAIARAPSALAAAPRLPELYDFVGHELGRRGHAAQAMGAHATALGFAPDDRSALLGFARARLDAGGAEAQAEAMRALDRLAVLDPDDADALETAGMVALRAGHVDEALPRFARAAARGPMAAASHVALAIAAERAGRRDEAMREWEAAQRIAPDDALILDKLGAPRAADRPRHPTPATAWLPKEWR
jgi:Cytochrome c554 and c-prime